MKLKYLIAAICLCNGIVKSMDDSYRKERIKEAKRNASRTGVTIISISGQGTTIHEGGQVYQKPVLVGSGKEKINKYNIAGINTITIQGGNQDGAMIGNGNMRTTITQFADDNIDMLTIKAEDSIMPFIVMEYEGTHLKLGLNAPNQDVKASQDIVFTVALRKKIDGLNLSAIGNCSVEMQNNEQLKADILSINKQDNAKINLIIDTNTLSVENNGNGKLKLAGNAIDQKLNLLHGSFLAQNLKSKRIQLAVIKGNGTIQLNAEESIKGTVAKNSNYDITYEGTPEIDLQAI